ncbi:MAG TPA: LuxR C-terminal-related transcriptional regulator [Microlunatus sp.]|nr:LuxR C-terminal-related transcriptional regulator [Microlunatus sp.]
MITAEPQLTESWLREADAFVAAAGERALQRKLHQILAAEGRAVPRSRPGAVPPQLAGLGVAAREADVLTLINTGLSNAKIADRLVLSVRTVESHVSSLLRKTGASSRARLPERCS